LSTDIVSKLNQQPPKKLESFVNKTVNRTRNIIKHHDRQEDETITADFYTESVMLINAGLENYAALFGSLPRNKEIDHFRNAMVREV
jgi:hypothetical protein